MRTFDRGRPIRSPQEIPLARRELLKGIASLGLLALLSYFTPACSQKTESPSSELPPGELPEPGKGTDISLLTPSPSQETEPPSSELAPQELPEPRKDSDVSIEEALLKRRSIRTYTGKALTLEEVSQLLWAAQGTTSSRGFRTAPSASALYPLETYIVVGDVENLSEGIYRYETKGHRLVKVLEGDYRPRLTRASLGWYFVEGGAIYIVFAAIYERTTVRAGNEGIKYVHMEVGHAAQNVYLQAVSLGLGTVVIGGFSSSRAQQILKLPENEMPLYFMPVGRT